MPSYINPEDFEASGYRLIRKRTSRYEKCDWEWVRYRRKDGTLGRWYERAGPYYIPLFKCMLCGKLGTPKKIQERSCVWGWNIEPFDYKTESKSLLCMGCWNKVRTLVKKQNEADECRILLNKLKRNIANECKNQDDRTTKGLSGEHDGGS